MKTSKWLAVSAAVALGALSAAPGQARELIYGSWLSPKSASNSITMTRYLKKIEKDTDGKVRFKLLAGGQVATAKGTMDAVKNGIIDAGFAIAPYASKTLPATNLIFNTNLLGDDEVAGSGAVVETLLLHCPQCIAEYKRNNAVSFSGFETPPYELLCTRPVHTVADLKGLKVRSSAGGIDIMRIAGATPVAMTVPAGVTAMERGTLDCSWAVLNWLTNFGYIDVTKYVLNYPLGMAGPPLPFYLNRDDWNSMTPAEHKVLVEDSAYLVATETLDAQYASTQKAIAKAKAQGIKFIKGGADFGRVMAQHAKNQRIQNLKIAHENGVKDPEAILDAYDAAFKKWKKLSKSIGHNKAKFIRALKREVYDKVDPSKL